MKNTYKPKSLRVKEKKRMPVMYGIGSDVGDDGKIEWSMCSGPFPDLETALEVIGSEGEYVVQLTGESDSDKAIWKWDDDEQEWVECD